MSLSLLDRGQVAHELGIAQSQITRLIDCGMLRVFASAGAQRRPLFSRRDVADARHELEAMRRMANAGDRRRTRQGTR